MNNTNRSRNFSSYFIIILFLIGIFVVLEMTRDRLGQQGTNYTIGQLTADLAAENVASAVLSPDAQSTTGTATITLKSGEHKTLNVTNLTEIEHLLRDGGVDAAVEAVPGDNSIMT